MIRDRLMRRLGLIMLAVFVLHVAATFLHWYSLVWWFDMPMHFLGGMAVFYISAVIVLPLRERMQLGRFAFDCVLGGLLIGVLWEAFELYLYMRYGFPPFSAVDSLSDVCFDIAGLCLAAYGAMPILNAAAPSRV